MKLAQVFSLGNYYVLITQRHYIPLIFNHIFQSKQHLLRGKWTESEASASGLQGGDDFGQIIADDTEASVFSEFLNYSSQSILRILRHGIRFIKNNKFEAGMENCPCAGEVEDFATDCVNTTVVRGIQF